MDLRNVDCKNDRWVEVTEDRVQWRALLSTVLKLWDIKMEYYLDN